MTAALSAQDLLFEMQRMAQSERAKFFKLLTNKAFQTDNATYKQVFGSLEHEAFASDEAAQYLEISMPTLRRYVQSGKLKPSHVVGRSQMFSTQALRALKRARQSHYSLAVDPLAI